MGSTEQEKDKQNSATAEDQDNMAATSEFRSVSRLYESFTKFEPVLFLPTAETQRIDTLSRPKPVPVGFIEDR